MNFDAVLTQHGESICRCAMKYASRFMVPLDVMLQSGRIALWKAASRHEIGRANLATFLYRRISGQMHDDALAERGLKRDRKYTVSFIPIADLEANQEPFEHHVPCDFDRHEILRRCIAELNQKVRLTITLFYFDGLSLERIADQMKSTPGAVAQRLRHGRAKLRQALTESELCS